MSRLTTASDIILTPAALEYSVLERVLGQAIQGSVDYADLYMQYTQSESWGLEDGIVKSGEFHVDRGFGLRAISGEAIGFAYADCINLKELNHAAKTANSIARAGQSRTLPMTHSITAPQCYPQMSAMQGLADTDKVALLQGMDQTARAMDARIQHVNVQLSSQYEVILLLNAEGEWVADIRPLFSLMVQVIAISGERQEQGFAAGGGRYRFDPNGEHQVMPKTLVQQAVAHALLNLEAIDAPAGQLPVVLGPGWPAVLLHEAVGHGLEADFNRKGSSAFSDRLGESVASSLCTIVDDGTLLERRGSLSVDDEGVPSQCTVLIENGVLKNYMQDRHNARLMGMQPTGNGRRQSYAHCPLPRMTNTYMLPGEQDPNEIIASVDYGVYAVDFAGGQVDITNGNFVFSASKAFLIEKGKVTTPIKGATLIGNGPETLKHVSMVGNDLKLDQGLGTCGKDGQSVPVGVGQPTLKVDLMTVGGVSQ